MDQTDSFTINFYGTPGYVATRSFAAVCYKKVLPVTTYQWGNIPTSINEGSSGTFVVNTTNVTDGTTLYWSVGSSSDVNSGSPPYRNGFGIIGNTGSFTITAYADNTTEGPESLSLGIYTTSSGGTPVITTPITINDTSTS